MKKIFAQLMFMFLMLTCSYAQYTTVTATGITDSDGTLWANGTVSVALQPNPAQANLNNYKLCSSGASLSTAVTTQGPVSLGSGGSFSFTVYDNSLVCPQGSQYQFTVCPDASSKCGVITLPVTGTSVNITSQIDAMLPLPRFPAVIGNYGYTDAEAILSLEPGNIYYNVNDLCYRGYSGATWACVTGNFISIPVTVAQGGTGATTASGALANLGGISSTATTAQSTAGSLAVAGSVSAPTMLSSTNPFYCAEAYMTTAMAGDYGQAINATDTAIGVLLPTYRPVIRTCVQGSHPVSTPIQLYWGLLDTTGSVLVPQSGGAGGIWGASPVSIPSCTGTSGSTTVTCSATTGLTAGMRVGGIGLSSANRISGAPASTTFQAALSPVVRAAGLFVSGSATVCGLNTVKGLVAGQTITNSIYITSGTTISAVYPYTTTNCPYTQSLVMSAVALATSQEEINGNLVATPSTITVTSGTWPLNVSAMQTANVVTFVNNPLAPVNFSYQNFQGQGLHISIEDPGYRTLNGVNGIEIWGQDSFDGYDFDVRNIEGTCFTFGGWDSTAPPRESFFDHLKCVDSGEYTTGQASIEMMTNGSHVDEINQVNIEGAEIVYSHGDGMVIGTYQTGTNGPRQNTFSNMQIEGGSADSINAAYPGTCPVHILIGSNNMFSGDSLLVPGYGGAVICDDTQVSHTRSITGSVYNAANHQYTYQVVASTSSPTLTYVSGPSPTPPYPITAFKADGMMDGNGCQISGTNVFTLPLGATNTAGTTLTLTANSPVAGTVTLRCGAGGYYTNDTSPHELDTFTSLAGIYDDADTFTWSLLGVLSPGGFDAGAIPARGEFDYKGFQTWGTSTSNSLAYFQQQATFQAGLASDSGISIKNGDLYLARTDQGASYILRPNTTGYKILGFGVNGGGMLDFMNLNSTQVYNPGIYIAGSASVPFTTAAGFLDATQLVNALPNGMAATTQALNDATTKVATDAFVQNQVATLSAPTIRSYPSCNGTQLPPCSFSLTGQTAALSPVTLYTPATAGVYRITEYVQTTTVGTAGNMTGAVTYNPGNGAKNPAVTGTALLTTTGSTGISTGTFFLYSSSSQGIQYGVQWSGVTGSPVYSVYGILE